ncbi:MAG: DNA-methyltransferase [Treponema sp.]
MKEIKDESVDAVVTDPPYQYLNTKLKNSAFDKPYDESAFITEVQRILKPTGFIVMSGRGVAFYRQGVLLDKAGFKFKEEVIWEKYTASNPAIPLRRLHESIFIFAKDKGVIKQRRVPYLEVVQTKADPINQIKNDIHFIRKELKNKVKLNEILRYLKTGEVKLELRGKTNSPSYRENSKITPNYINYLNKINKGFYENSIIKITHLKNAHHPTEKPVRLMERLIALVTEEGQTVVDPFMGSGTTGVACMNTDRNFIGMELDEKYLETALKRIEEAIEQQLDRLF